MKMKQVYEQKNMKHQNKTSNTIEKLFWTNNNKVDTLLGENLESTDSGLEDWNLDQKQTVNLGYLDNT